MKDKILYGNIHLHIHIIGRYNPSVSIIDLVSHSVYVVCANFIHKWRGPKKRIKLFFFLGTFNGNYIYSRSFCQKSPKKYFLYFVLMSGLGNHGHTLHLYDFLFFDNVQLIFSSSVM